jgi:hypothetical protein
MCVSPLWLFDLLGPSAAFDRSGDESRPPVGDVPGVGSMALIGHTIDRLDIINLSVF